MTVDRRHALNCFYDSDADSKEVFLDEPEWGTQQEAFDAANKTGAVREVHFPASMLSAKALSREVVFSSTEAIKELKLVQKMYLHYQLVETLEFDFPFVIPGTTNSWE